MQNRNRLFSSHVSSGLILPTLFSIQQTRTKLEFIHTCSRQCVRNGCTCAEIIIWAKWNLALLVDRAHPYTLYERELNACMRSNRFVDAHDGISSRKPIYPNGTWVHFSNTRKISFVVTLKYEYVQIFPIKKKNFQF